MKKVDKLAEQIRQSRRLGLPPILMLGKDFELVALSPDLWGKDITPERVASQKRSNQFMIDLSEQLCAHKKSQRG